MFHEKIERTLRDAGRPSYESLNMEDAIDLTHLYRARSAQHEGDCYYKDVRTGRKHAVDMVIAERLLLGAERFIFWVEAQV